MRIKLLVGVGLVIAASHLLGQIRPAAFNHSVPFKVGLGYSGFKSDWDGRIAGPTLWMDWGFPELPGKLNGLGIEAEARDLNYARSGKYSTMRFDTAAAGPTYTFTFGKHPRIRPYEEFLMGLGSIDFGMPKSRYLHDTRTIYEPGAGVDWLISPRLRLRAGYEYQIWPDLFPHRSIHPTGITIGTQFDFVARRTRPIQSW